MGFAVRSSQTKQNNDTNYNILYLYVYKLYFFKTKIFGELKLREYCILYYCIPYYPLCIYRKIKLETIEWRAYSILSSRPKYQKMFFFTVAQFPHLLMNVSRRQINLYIRSCSLFPIIKSI